MATGIANSGSTQNFTGAATFAAAEIGALALNLIRNTTASLATATNVTSATFTVTNLKVIDAVLLWLKTSGTTGTGTFKVDLQKGGVSQASVTVNKSDLPDSTNAIPVPVLFKLTSNATGDGGANWTIVLTTTSGSGSATITYNINAAGATNLTRALRTTTAMTAAAADDLYIVGELTGAGTHTSRTVTMNQTATTAYGNGTVNSTVAAGGGIHVSCYGTLAYGNTSTINYVLRINGDLIVYQFGTFSEGSSGSEIPRDGSAVLEFQQASADGDFGLRVLDNATWNAAGLSRTVGKNVVQCKQTSDVTGSNVLTSGPTALNVTNATSGGLDAGGTSILASTAIDTVTNANHTLVWSGPSITNTTQSFQVWLARGTGTNNRFVRLEAGNNSVLASVTKGFFADVDLQAGTIGACTAVGTGTATSSAITAVGGGFLCTIVGKVDASAATPSVFIAICSAAGTTSFAGANNQALLYEGVQLVTTSSIGDTTFNVDTDTGWLSGDQICVASTTRTGTDCENFVLSANAGASSLVTHLYPFGYGGPTVNVAGTHSGTTPTQAEIGLLTRNVKIRSTSNSLMAYVYCAASAVVTVSWAQFYYVGVNAVGKRGIEVDGSSTTAGAKSFTFCSIHDAEVGGFYANSAVGAASLNLTFSNNVLWNTATATSGNAFTISSAMTGSDWTASSNLSMKTGLIGYSLTSVTGTFTNNTAVGAVSTGFTLADGTANGPTIGTFTGLVAHSCGSFGMNMSTAGVGTIGFTGWRNNATGLSLASGTLFDDVTFNNLNLFGNSGSNLTINSGGILNITGTSVMAGDTTFSTTNGFTLTSASLDFFGNFSGLDMSGTGGIYAPHSTTDFNTTAANSRVGIYIVASNCKFGALTLTRTNWATGSYIACEKYGQVAGDHRCEMTFGQIKTDTTIFNNASPSQRLTPNNATYKLESATKAKGLLKRVVSGSTVSISASVRKSAAGDGAAYNGNQPRLIQRANPALGQTSDVVIDTYASGTGSWHTLSGSSSSATDDGAFEFIVDCDGTTGWINVDDPI